MSVLLDGQKFIFRLELVVGEAVGERIKAMEGLSQEKSQIWLAWLLKQNECWNFPGEKVSRNTGNTVILLYCRMLDFTIKIV